MSYEKYAAKLERSFKEDKKEKLKKATKIRFKKEQIVHARLGGDRKTHETGALVTNAGLQRIITNYQEGKDGASDKLHNVLSVLIAKCNDRFDLKCTQEELDECLRRCIDKANRFNPTRGKAFNFFITVTLGILRELYRSRKRLALMDDAMVVYRLNRDTGRRTIEINVGDMPEKESENLVKILKESFAEKRKESVEKPTTLGSDRKAHMPDNPPPGLKKFDSCYYRSKMLAAHNAFHELRYKVIKKVEDKSTRDEIIKFWDQYIYDAQSVDKYYEKSAELRDVKIPKPYTFTQKAKDSYAKHGINLVE